MARQAWYNIDTGLFYGYHDHTSSVYHWHVFILWFLWLDKLCISLSQIFSIVIIDKQAWYIIVTGLFYGHYDKRKA